MFPLFHHFLRYVVQSDAKITQKDKDECLQKADHDNLGPWGGQPGLGRAPIPNSAQGMKGIAQS